jgi:hypothetical protein
MFTAADDAALGLKVEHGVYPDGEEGIQKSLVTICRKIKEGCVTAVMKSYAGNLMKENGFPEGVRAQSAVALNHVRSKIMYAPDALGSEQIESAVCTLCVEGAPICIPISDCDGLVVALGTIIAALGHDVEVVRQKFGDGHQQHVLIEVRDDNGLWFPLDPSSKTMPAGKKSRAEEETRHSPWDSSFTGLSDQAQFVGIGRPLDVFVWRKESWHHVGVGKTLEEAATACCDACVSGTSCQVNGMQTQETRVQRKGGLGAPWPSVAALAPQFAWLGQYWAKLDPKNRSWQDTLQSAYGRAERGNWEPGDSASQYDLIALIIASAFQAKAVESMPGPGPRWAAALRNTWIGLAKRAGYQGESVEAIKAAAQKRNDTANLAFFEVILIIVGVLAVAAIYCWLIYQAFNVIKYRLALDKEEKEQLRLHSEGQKIVDRHLQNPDLPWTPEEMDILKRLEERQDAISRGIMPKPPGGDDASFWDSPWAYVGLAGVAGGVVIAIVYRNEIKRFLGSGA